MDHTTNDVSFRASEQNCTNSHSKAHEDNADPKCPDTPNPAGECAPDEELRKTCRCPWYDGDYTLAIGIDVVVLSKLVIGQDDGHDSRIVS